MSLDFANPEFLDGQNEGMTLNLSPSSSSIVPSPNTSPLTSKPNHPEPAGTPGILPDLTPTKQLFDRIVLTDDITPARTSPNPSMLLA